LVTDPGPDPDDVKVLLVLAVLHRRGLIDFVGAVCNGGGQPALRAQLARCVLDTVGAREIPVAIGSAGKPYSAQPHEYAIEGFDAVDPTRLLDGPTLIAARSPSRRRARSRSS
jgi:inosine-uridine nucleoside N-ribohydrolase